MIRVVVVRSGAGKVSRIFAIGDIHGEYKKLIQLISILRTNHNLDLTMDKLIFMGDYIDRGPDSASVLRQLYKLQKTSPKNVICLLGNHEKMMIDWYEGVDKWGLWIINGGVETQKSFDPMCPKYLLKWLKKLPYIHREDGFVFTHAPLPREENRKSPRRARGFFTQEECIWPCSPGKEHEYSRNMLWDNTIGVCGHIHALRENKFEPRLYPHYIFTDAGCGCHNEAPLCAVEVHSREVIYSVF